MANALNAPGERPSPKRVEEVARKAIEVEDPDEPVPAFVLDRISQFLTTNPADFNFLLELKGGNGYGSVTCMEDLCWTDVLLSTDIESADGGLANGLGSMWEYAVHCSEDSHKKGRDARMVKQGLSVPTPGAAASSSLPLETQPPTSPFASSSFLDQSSQPSPAPFNRSLPKGHFKTAMTSSPSVKPEPLQGESQRVNLSSSTVTSRDKGKGKAKMHGSGIISLLDSDDDDDIVFAGRSTPRVKMATSKWEQVWSKMTISEKLDAAKRERKCLRRAYENCQDADLKKVIAARREEIRALSAQLAFKVWQPPKPELFKAIPFHKYDMSEKLAVTFDAPRTEQHDASGSSSTVDGTVGGSMSPWSFSQRDNNPFNAALARPPGSYPYSYSGPQAAAGPSGLTMSGKAAAAIQAVTNNFGSLVDAMKSYADGSGHFFNQHLPAGGIGTVISGLPGLPGGLPPYTRSTEDIEDALGYELNRPSDLNTFFKDSLEDFSEDATVDEGLKILKLNSLQDKIPGANFTLLPHQVLGVSWMVKREEREVICGGLLCDAMGLGKTVQCIGLMLARDERPNDFKGCPQLIIAPLALLNQWKSEILSKTTRNWKVCIHHGPGRAKSASALKKFDIILTTFGTLSAESGLKTKAQRKQSRSRKRDEGSDYESDVETTNKKGPLFRVKWFRVTVDEAHQMRNRSTKTAKSILNLDCLHPWILTGTPIVNTLADLGPPLVFTGKVDFEHFHKNIVAVEKKRPRLASKRAQAALRGVMMRRNKDTEIDGKRILNLPPKTTNMEPLHFEAEERAIYAAIEQRARVRVNKFIKQGTLLKHYSVVLVLLTRLRQCVNHPWLLRRRPGEEGREDDMVVDDDAFTGNMTSTRENDADEFGRAVAFLGKDAVEKLAKKLETRHQAMCDETTGNNDIDVECSICYEPFVDNELITACGHLYCRTCLDNLFVQPARDGSLLSDEEAQRGCRSCPLCRTLIEPGRIFRAKALWQPPQDEKPEVEEAEEEAVGPSRAKGKKRAASLDPDFFDKKPRLNKGKGRVIDLDMDDEDEVEEQPEVALTPSTKMRRILELVQGYVQEDPNTKIIIFSQFVQFLDLLGTYFELNSVRYTGYRGSMSQNERDESIRRFSMPSSIVDPINVILISTKAGGVGLNLTMATKVIMADLAYSPTTEAQAVDRAHRIGQTKEVIVERLVIQDTVEDRLLEIQERKGLLADGALGEGAIGKIGRLTERDIVHLFGIGAEMGRDDDD